jgi:hypothetical protein
MASSSINVTNETKATNVVETSVLEEEESEPIIGSTDISSIPPILLEPGSKDVALHAM